MAVRKDKTDDPKPKPKAKATVVIHARPMDQQQEHHLRTAVDALLAEFVRRKVGRGKQS